MGRRGKQGNKTHGCMVVKEIFYVLCQNGCKLMWISNITGT